MKQILVLQQRCNDRTKAPSRFLGTGALIVVSWIGARLKNDRLISEQSVMRGSAHHRAGVEPTKLAAHASDKAFCHTRLRALVSRPVVIVWDCSGLSLSRLFAG